MLLSNHVYLLNGLSILCYALTACVAATVPSQCGQDNQAIEDLKPILLASDDPDSPFPSLEGQAITRHTISKV